MVILGIDPGTALTGCGVIAQRGNRVRVLRQLSIQTLPEEPVERRLQAIYETVSGLIATYRPDRVAIEQVFFNRNVRSALAVGQARGVCLLAAAQAEIPVYEYTPLQVKQAVTGYGRATKTQVQEMVKMLLGLEKIPRPDDVADALAVALCCLHASPLQDQLNRLMGEET